MHSLMSYAVGSFSSQALLLSPLAIDLEFTNSFCSPPAYPTIKALVSGNVGLPCNISQTKEENSIKLILWYKNNVLGTPIYSIDARDTNMSMARHFVAAAYSDRASFELNIASRTALLVLRPLLPDDDGHYICRVDFRWTRTTISTVKLDVIGKLQNLPSLNQFVFNLFSKYN